VLKVSLVVKPGALAITTHFNCPDERPPLSDLISSISGFAEMTAGYLDMSNYNPFANEVSSTTKG